jgi:hypothetical protein
MDTQCYRANLVATGHLRDALRKRPQRTWLVTRNHYGSVVTDHVSFPDAGTYTANEADDDTYIHADLRTRQQSIKKRRRRFSVVVNIVDGYEKSGSGKSIPLHGQVCKTIDVKEGLLELPKANEDSEAEWLEDAECEINEKNYCE